MSAPPDYQPPQDPISDRLPAEGRNRGIPRSVLRIADVWIGALIAIGIVIVGSVIVAIADPTLADANPNNDSEGGLLATQAFLSVGLIGTALIYTARSNHGDIADAARRLGLRSFGVWIVLPTLAAIGIYLVSAGILASILSPEQEDVAENLGAGSDSAILITVLAGILIVPGAAVSEELFFRGFIFGGLRQSMSLWPAAIISGVVFGGLHLVTGNVAVALQLSLFGVILAGLYERTGVLWAPMFVHGLNNAVAFTLLVTDTI